ncbi:unnamed protein product [Chrysodeixis includens]|uniref:Uncharacterized protein n=1 Tax=Chrysodeixis includens TaxID=689277 RepID=A0A9N8L0L6_CHRIL|nr:unnamed protein product [Chrysodeixis includens]
MEALQGSMSDMMKSFHDRMSKFEAELKLSPTSTATLAADFAAFWTLVTEVLSCLQGQMEALARDVDTLEMRGRRKILLLHGVPELPKEDTSQVVAGVMLEHLKVEDFSVAAVRRCHKMGRNTNGSKPRPILLKPKDVDVRDKIWFGKTKLKGSGITLSEFLTKTRHDAFMMAREKFGVSSCWTQRGDVFIVSADGNKHRVLNTRDVIAFANLPEGKTKPVASSPVSESLATVTVAVPRKKRVVADRK